MRIEEHPILTFEKRRRVEFLFGGQKMWGYEGEPTAAALHANGVRVLRRSIKLNRPRGFYCAIGNCSSCFMTVNGEPNVRTCVEKHEPGIVVETQKGKGDLSETKIKPVSPSRSEIKRFYVNKCEIVPSQPGLAANILSRKLSMLW